MAEKTISSTTGEAHTQPDGRRDFRAFIRHLGSKAAGRRALVLVAVIALSSALLLTQSITAQRVLSDRFATLEDNDGQQSLTQIIRALEADLNQLAISTHDYAVWDDAYDYALDRNKEFLTSNFAVETLDNMNVDVVWVLDTQNRDIASFARVGSTKTGLPPPAPEELLHPLRPLVTKMWNPSSWPSLSRIVRTPQGLLAFSAHPITPTGGHGEARGLLLYGRFLDESVMERVRTTSQLPAALRTPRANHIDLPTQAALLWGGGIKGTDHVLVARNESVLDGFILLRDTEGEPVALLSTTLEREMLRFGRETEQTLMLIGGFIVALFALTVIGLLLYLEKSGREKAISERRYKAVITQARETMLLVDQTSRTILEANPAAGSTLGYSTAELVGKEIDDLFYACDGDVLKAVQSELHAAASLDRILIVQCKNRQFIDVEITSTPLNIEERELSSFVLRDVSARKKAERRLAHNQEKLEFLAHHDSLTGLLNRLGLERRLPEILEEATREQRHVSLLYLDIDHFKKINDHHGHTVGDRLLQIVAERLKRCVSADDLCVRMGGDEFVIISAGLRDPSSLRAIVDRIFAAFAEAIVIDTVSLQIAPSMGGSIFPEDGADYEVLLKNADIALYESKDAGRARFSPFSETMFRRVSSRLALEHGLRAAIAGGQFYLEYQPLVDLRSHRVASLEALVRWHHPVRGRVPPIEFIEIAEKSGLIVELGEFVVRQACRQLREWHDGGAAVVPIAVNVSTRQFERQSILALVESAARAAGVDPKLIHVELTESAFMDGHDRNVALLSEIRNAGIEVSIDDFGTGYSSLAYLKTLPVDTLKIDRAFVKDMNGQKGEAIVSTIVRMAKSLGLSTVAEGVETVAEARMLRDMGVTYGQGFYFSRPLAADACGRLLLPEEQLALPRIA